MKNCILKACCWAKDGNCKTLGECGAAYALREASAPGGYRVHVRENRTISALERAGLVTVRRTHDDSSHAIVTAKAAGSAVASTQDRIEDAA